MHIYLARLSVVHARLSFYTIRVNGKVPAIALELKFPISDKVTMHRDNIFANGQLKTGELHFNYSKSLCTV